MLFGAPCARIIAPLLMYGVLRYVESQGGSQLVAIGRREVVEKCVASSLRNRADQAGSIQSGSVEYELMTGETRTASSKLLLLSAAVSSGWPEMVDWALPFPFRQEYALLSRRSLLGRAGRRLRAPWPLAGSC